MKKGYTLVELVIVMVIIWVLMLAFRNVFQVKNKDSLYGEACINNLYGDVSNYLYSAITSKAITSGTDKIYPTIYYIDFDTAETGNAIRLAYSTGGAIITESYLSLTGTVPSNYNCKTNSYYMMLSGQFLQVKINKGLTEDVNLRSMSLSGGGIMPSTFTSDVKFLLKYPGSTWYKELGRFEVDIRTQSIKSKMCLAINNTWDCNNRNQ